MRWNAVLLLVAGLGLGEAAAWAEDAERFKDIASECRKSGGPTAIGKLPGVRIVVYDPVSNSFGFVACTSTEEDLDQATRDNLDSLDRRRIALPTQKIRLIVLPYNKLDGDLFLKVSRGAGKPEFDEFSLGGAAAVTVKATSKTESEAAPKGTEDKKVADVPKVPTAELPSGPLKAQVEKARGLLQQQLGRLRKPEQDRDDEDGMPPAELQTLRQFYLAPPPLAQESKKPPQVVYLLVSLEELFREFSDQAAELGREIRQWQKDDACVKDRIDAASSDLSRRLARGEDNDERFTLARDVTLAAVIKEIERREALSRKDTYSPCHRDATSFVDDANTQGNRLDDFTSRASDLDFLRSEIDDTLSRLEKEDPPTGVSLAEWLDQIDEFRSAAKETTEFVNDVDAQTAKLDAGLEQRREEYAAFTGALFSPSFQDERYNFPPLGKGEVLVLKVSRGTPPKDGELIPGQSNELELRFAPAYVARFGTGLVFSRLKDPKFKFDRENFIRFDEEGNGEVLPALFVHNFWGRRSPLLSRTRFEKFVPGLSLGVPLVQGEGVLEELLLGLDWELVSGVDFNLGVHFGKVNALRDPKLLNTQHTPPTGETLDIADFQKETTDHAVYFGIVVNSDIFKLFQNGGNGGNGE